MVNNFQNLVNIVKERPLNERMVADGSFKIKNVIMSGNENLLMPRRFNQDLLYLICDFIKRRIETGARIGC